MENSAERSSIRASFFVLFSDSCRIRELDNQAFEKEDLMNTFREKADQMDDITNYRDFADALEEYALDGIGCRSPVLQKVALEVLKNKMKAHVLAAFSCSPPGKGYDDYYICSGKDAFFPFVYSRLMDLGCFGNYDMEHVRALACQMKNDYEPADTESINDQGIQEIMTWMDTKYQFSTRIERFVPMFLIMDQAPIYKRIDCLREGCEVSSYAFIFWKTRIRTMLSVPPETAFLIRISEEIVKEAWHLEEDYLSIISDELTFLGCENLSTMDFLMKRKVVADLVCIGIAYDSPFQRYIPFLVYEKEYIKATIRIVNKLLEIIKEKRGF